MADFLQAGEADRVDTRGFLQSLDAAAWSRRDSEDSVSTEQENSFIRMINQAEAGINAVQTPENINTNTFVGAQDMIQTMSEAMNSIMSDESMRGDDSEYETVASSESSSDVSNFIPEIESTRISFILNEEASPGRGGTPTVEAVVVKRKRGRPKKTAVEKKSETPIKKRKTRKIKTGFQRGRARTEGFM